VTSINKVPLDVVRYLRALQVEAHRYAYIGLDSSRCVRFLGGDLALFGLDVVDKCTSIENQLAVLVGLLPSGAEPVVISNARGAEKRYFDLHLFTQQNRQWVLFLDNNEAGQALQSEQQTRLQNELVIEQALNSNRQK